MAKVGLLSFSDGRDYVHEEVREGLAEAERALRTALENDGHTVITGAAQVTSNEVAVTEARRVEDARPDCVLFNFAVWAFPHFAMLAASEIASPIVLVATPDPARPGLVAMLAAAGGLDQVGRTYGRVWGDPSAEETYGRLRAHVSGAAALSSLRGTTFGRIGGRPMGMYTAAADPAEWIGRFGIDVEEIDQLELVRRADEASAAEAREGREWLEANCGLVAYDDDRLTPEVLERQLRMYLAMQDLIDDWNLDFTGIKGQPELSTHYCIPDVAEALLNDPYDWRGPKPVQVCATEADMDAALTMQILHKMSGTPVLFADVRHYHPDRKIWDLCNSGQHATWLAERSDDPAENLAGVSLFPADIYFPAGGASVHHFAAPGDFTFARLTRGEAGYRMHVIKGEFKRFEPEVNKALGEQTSPTWPHVFARLGETDEAFMSSYASNHIHAVPGDWRADLDFFCRLLDIDYIEL